MEKWGSDEGLKAPEYTCGGVSFSPVVTRGTLWVEQYTDWDYHREQKFIAAFRRLKLRMTRKYPRGLYGER